MVMRKPHRIDVGQTTAQFWNRRASSGLERAAGGIGKSGSSKKHRIAPVKTPGFGEVVPRKGLDPSRLLSHWHLKPARLPIPPPGPRPSDREAATYGAALAGSTAGSPAGPLSHCGARPHRLIRTLPRARETGRVP